jgi:hypothetical protein
LARDGSGNYSLPQAAFVAGTTIESAKVNSNLSDIGSALTQSISKDGQTTYTASQPMGGFKLTGLGAGTGLGESIRYDEFKAAFRSHLAGLQMSSRTNTTITYGAGSWTEEGQGTVFSHAGGVIDCATTGALGLDTGALANNTWYHAFAIGKTDLTTSLLASTSVSSPTMPSGYTLKRRIGSFKTNGSAQIIDFVQDGDEFLWASGAVQDASLTDPGTSIVLRTMSVPTGLPVWWNGKIQLQNTNTGNNSGAGVGSPSQTTVSNMLPNVITAASGVGSANSPPIYIRTNTSAQINTQIFGFSSALVTLTVSTFGWRDRRGRDA